MKKKTISRVFVTASIMALWTASAEYVTDGLVLHYDAIDNVGTGVHDSSSPIWKELTGKGGDFTLPEGAAWDGDCISFSRIKQTCSVLGSDFTDMTQQDFTFEFVARIDPREDLSLNPDVDHNVIQMRRGSLWYRRPGIKRKDAYGAVGSTIYTTTSMASGEVYWYEFSNYHGELHTVDYLKGFHTFAIKERATETYTTSTFQWAVDGDVYYDRGAKVGENGGMSPNSDLSLGDTGCAVQIRAIRVYNRHLTESEIAQNAAEDAVRWPAATDAERPHDPFADARWYFRGAKGTSDVNGGYTNIVNSLQAGGSPVGVPNGATPADRVFSDYGANSNCVIRTMDVVSPFSGRTLRERKVMDFRQCARATSDGKMCYPSVKRVRIPGCYTNMHETTVVARFRIDDYPADEHSTTLSLMDVGYAWSGESGTSLRLFESGDNGFWVRAYHGSNADNFNGMLSNERFRIRKGKWIDFALTVNGRENWLYCQTEDGDFYSEMQNADVVKNKDTRVSFLNIGADMVGAGTPVTKEIAASSVTQFRGQIQQLAVWDRALTPDEVRQCFREDCGDADDALKLGVVNGSAAEFAGSSMYVDAGSADAWLMMTNAFAKAGDTLTVRFDLPSDRIFLPRTFRFSPTQNAPSGATLAVRLNGYLVDDALAVEAGKTSAVAVPPVVFKAAGNTLVIERTDGQDGYIGIDAVSVTAGGAEAGTEPTGVRNVYDVYSDAYCWYAGFADEDGDGYFFPDDTAATAIRFCDVRDALRIGDSTNDAHKWRHSATVPGSYFRHEKTAVSLPAAGLTIPDESCLRIVAENVGTEEVPRARWGGLARPMFGVTNAVGYTALARVRFNGYMHPNHQQVGVFGTGYDWSNKRGCCLAFAGDPSNMKIKVNMGYSSLWFEDTQSGPERNHLAQGKWIDVAYAVSNGYVRVYTCVEGGEIVEQIGNGGVGALGDPALTSTLCVGTMSGGGQNGSANMDDFEGFDGLFHHVAVWSRTLSAEEVALAMKWPKPDIFHMGVVNGSDQEFLGADQPFEVSASGAFRSASVHIAPGESYEIRFSCDDSQMRANQRLVVATTGTSCDAQFRVTLNGENIINYAESDRSEVKFLTVQSGGWSEFGVRGAFLRAENVLTLTRVDGNDGPVFLDAVSLGNLGRHVRVLMNGGLKVIVR